MENTASRRRRLRSGGGAKQNWSGRVCSTLRVRLPLLLFLACVTAAGPSRCETVVDISWARKFEPIHGAFNRDEPIPVNLTLHIDGQVDSAKIVWALLRGDSLAASGDTVIAGTARTRERVFTLRLPALKPGRYALRTIADPENLLEEKDEGNNRAAFALVVPNAARIHLRCESPDRIAWKIYRTELSTASGSPYPDEYGTRPDTVMSSEYEIAVSGIVPGDYSGVLFGPSVNRAPILIASGNFEMAEPPSDMKIVWPRTTPYLVAKPKLSGEVPGSAGGESGSPRWKGNAKVNLEGSVYNPAVHSADVQWRLHFVGTEGAASVQRDTLLSLGAFSTGNLVVTGRVPREAGKYMLQAEVRVPWPSGFEDLGEEERVASHILPLGWIEIER